MKTAPRPVTDLSSVFRKKNVGLYRMTATDAALARLMRDELALRRPHRPLEEVKRALPGPLVNFSNYVKGKMPKALIEALGFVDEPERDHVVLVSEWDTSTDSRCPNPLRDA